jgi:hypothetical protein
MLNILPASAEDNPSDGTWTFGGALRARLDVRFDDADSSGNRTTTSHIGFDTLIVKAGYDSSTLFGAMQYRFYGGSFPYTGAPYKGQFGEVNFPVDTYLGYKFGPKDKVTAGLSPVPFGPDQFFSPTFYETLGYVMGIEDTHDVGIKYTHADDHLKIDAGFYPTTSGNWVGYSHGGDRYSTNFVKADSYVAGGSNNDERNMVIGRIGYTFPLAEKASIATGVSGWYASLHNFDTDKDGSVARVAADVTGTKGPWQTVWVVARQDIDAKNPGSNQTVTVGGYDGSYNMAAKGTFLSASFTYNDLGAVKWVTGITPYLNYSAYYKDQSDFKDSQRFIVGVSNTFAGLSGLYLYTELMVGKNDPYIGAGQYVQGLGAGAANQWKTMLYANLGFYF